MGSKITVQYTWKCLQYHIYKNHLSVQQSRLLEAVVKGGGYRHNYDVFYFIAQLNYILDLELDVLHVIYSFSKGVIVLCTIFSGRP